MSSVSAASTPTSEASPFEGWSEKWWRDRAVWWAILFSLYVRGLTLAYWLPTRCIRDECGYLLLAGRIVNGHGLTPSGSGWLWAPGYPYLLAVHELLFDGGGAARVTQLVLTPVMLIFAWKLGGQLGGRRAARWALALFALSPTLTFFSMQLWSESVYTTLLMGALLAMTWTRQGGPARGVLPGLLVGLCVLFRGVATYMLPIFAVGLLWGRLRSRSAWASVGALALGAALTVGPWAVHASQRWEGLVLSDRTMGQMMWLGNNDFPPVTFDYGNGLLTDALYEGVTSTGRPHCEKTGPVAWDACEVANGKRWIREHPAEFLRRVPVRLAQLFNPHSFLTRHLRWGKWGFMPEALREGLIAMTVLWSGVAVLGGTTGLLARGRGALAVVTGGILLYHVAAIGMLAGLTRYRVPLDALGLLWAAALLAWLRPSFKQLWNTPWRMLTCLFLLCFLVPLMLYSLPLGYPK